MLGALLDGLNASGAEGAGAVGGRGDRAQGEGTRNGGNLSTALGTMELCWGDVGFLLSMPRQGLGNAAIAAVTSAEQLPRFAGRWAAMATPDAHIGSDSAALRTTTGEPPVGE